MRVLFTSDPHALPEAFRGFAAALASFDVGVISGDLLNDYVSDEELIRMLHLSPDDFLEELPDPDATPDDLLEKWRTSAQRDYLLRGLEEKEREMKLVLGTANKPVLVVRGNHDLSPFTSEDLFRNIHLRKVEIGGVPFVGYGWLGRELDPERQMDDFDKVEPLIDGSTILVTHCPPAGVLDGAGRGGRMQGVGSEALATALKRTPPRFHLFGHSHASAGSRGTSINGAYPDLGHFFGIDTETGRIWRVRNRARTTSRDGPALLRYLFLPCRCQPAPSM